MGPKYESSNMLSCLVERWEFLSPMRRVESPNHLLKLASTCILTSESSNMLSCLVENSWVIWEGLKVQTTCWDWHLAWVSLCHINPSLIALIWFPLFGRSDFGWFNDVLWKRISRNKPKADKQIMHVWFYVLCLLLVSQWMLDGWFGLSGVCLVATVKGNSWSGWCDRGRVDLSNSS